MFVLPSNTTQPAASGVDSIIGSVPDGFAALLEQTAGNTAEGSEAAVLLALLEGGTLEGALRLPLGELLGAAPHAAPGEGSGAGAPDVPAPSGEDLAELLAAHWFPGIAGRAAVGLGAVGPQGQGRAPGGDSGAAGAGDRASREAGLARLTTEDVADGSLGTDPAEGDPGDGDTALEGARTATIQTLGALARGELGGEAPARASHARAESSSAAGPRFDPTGSEGRQAPVPGLEIRATEQVGGTPRGDAGRPEPGGLAVRVAEIVERLEQGPPPRQLTLELGDLRLSVSLRADSTVRVTVLSGLTSAEEAWREDLSQALAEHGFDLDGQGGHASDGQEPDGGRLAPVVTRSGTDPLVRPDQRDTDIRL